MPKSFFPSSVSGARLPDSLLADAYESSRPQERGWIKSTLALVESVHEVSASRVELRVERRSLGYGLTTLRTEVPWVMLFLEPPYVSPVRLAAAVMVARLAGIDRVFAVWAGKSTMPGALLTALELTGVEPLFGLTGMQPLELIQHLATEHGRGRVLYLGGHDGENSQGVKEVCSKQDVPLWEDSTRLFFGITPGVSPDTELLIWAHPDARFLVANGHEKGLRFGAIYCESVEESPVRAPLMLLPGLEGVWVHPDLDPSFFQNTESRVYLVPFATEEPLEEETPGGNGEKE